MKINSEQEMLDFGRYFAKRLQSENKTNSVIELIGDVGAGKTTFVRGLAEGLNIDKPITSPSFTISKSYAFEDNKTLTHYDFYRLKDPGLMSENLNEAITNNHLVVVEWADTVKNLLPENHVKITITLNDDGSRDVISQISSRPFATTGDEPASMMCPKGHEDLARAAWELLPTGHAMLADSSPKISLFLDTSTPTTILKIDNNTYTYEFANTLSEKLLQFIHDKLEENHKSWHDIEKIVFMSGPGSFTGLRIGAAVVNTLSHELKIPLYDHHGVSHKIILPDYGRGANITKPKK